MRTADVYILPGRRRPQNSALSGFTPLARVECIRRGWGVFKA